MGKHCSSDILAGIYLFLLHQNLGRETSDWNHELLRNQNAFLASDFAKARRHLSWKWTEGPYSLAVVKIPPSDHGFCKWNSGPLCDSGCRDRGLRGWW